MADKAKFKINSDKFVDFISKLDDLTKIEDTIKLKIDNDNILFGDIADEYNNFKKISEYSFITIFSFDRLNLTLGFIV